MIGLPTPRAARATAAAGLLMLLIACGGGDPNRPTETVTPHPLSVALRPGEVETVRYVADQPTTTLFTPSDRFGSRWLDIGFAQACKPADPLCESFTLTADATDDHRPADRLTWAFTYDPDSPISAKVSYMPVNPFPATPVAAPPAVRIAAGRRLSAAIDADGQAWLWGSNEAQAIDNSDYSYRSQPTPLRLAQTLPPLHAIDVASPAVDDDETAFVVAIDENRRVWMWGALNQVFFGSDLEQIRAPHRVSLPADDAIAVAAGARHVLVLRADGTVWGWGSTRRGALGEADPEGGSTATPVQVVGLSRIVAIAAGDYHNLALDADGVVWAWGSNQLGQLGDPTTTGEVRRQPQAVAGIGPVNSIDAGAQFSVAVRRDGKVWTWGRADRNQLGRSTQETCRLFDGDLPCSSRAGRAGSPLDHVDSVAAGADFVIARQTDGTVWAWGNNASGQLGGLPGLGSIAPVQVAHLGPALSIAAGGGQALVAPIDQSCAVGGGRVGSRLAAWGENLDGERGDGTALNATRNTPVLNLGDDGRCAATIGHRLIVVLSGTARGRVTSSEPGLVCSAVLCWQTEPAGRSVTLTATPDTGAERGEWRWDCAAAGSADTATVQLDGPRHCKVRFMVAGSVTYRTLHVTVEGSGRVASEPAGLDCSDDCQVDFAEDTAVQLRATPAAGYALEGFSGDIDCRDGHVTMSRARTCTARFVAQSSPPAAPVLSLDVSAGGRITSAPAGLDCGPAAVCQAAFPSGTDVVLTAVAEAGYRFEGYAGDAACGERIVLTASTACTARFVAVPVAAGFRLTVQRTGPAAPTGLVQSVQPDASIDCGGTCDALYPAGTIVSLRATAAAGRFFSHWTGCNDTGHDEDDNLLCFVRMDADRTVQADFE